MARRRPLLGMEQRSCLTPGEKFKSAFKRSARTPTPFPSQVETAPILEDVIGPCAGTPGRPGLKMLGLPGRQEGGVGGGCSCNTQFSSDKLPSLLPGRMEEFLPSALPLFLWKLPGPLRAQSRWAQAWRERRGWDGMGAWPLSVCPQRWEASLSTSFSLTPTRLPHPGTPPLGLRFVYWSIR